MSPRTRKGSLPQLCKHKASGRGYATDPYTRRPAYFGTYGTPECQAAYDHWIQRLLTRRAEGPRSVPPGQPVTVAHLILAYLDHAGKYYRKHGQPTSEISNIKRMAISLNHQYGTLEVGQFGTTELKALRQWWIVAQGFARKHANGQVGRLRRMFRWGVETNLVPVEVLQRLLTVPGLSLGRTEAREEEPVLPVAREHVEAVLVVARPVLASMIRLQLLGSMRPEDVVRMRGEDIDRTAEPWLYRPWRHKMEHKGRSRVIPLGPQARAILTPLLAARPEGWLFPSRVRHTGHLTVAGYRRGIGRACLRAGVPHWYPLMLRHTGLTEVRAKYGLEGAQMIAGHAHAQVTEIYATSSLDLAKKIAEENG